jgi:hypothetical protein
MLVVFKFWKKSEKNERFSLLVLAGCLALLAALLFVRF